MLRKISVFFFIIIASAALAWVIYPFSRQVLLSTGLIQVEVNIAGTGSMYPTFPKGESDNDIVNAKEIVAWPKMRNYPSGFSILGKKLFGYELSHGDIVEFDNEKTRTVSKEKYGDEAGFVKRVIALPGDTIELRDGFVYLNGKILDEPYTAKARSTYGGEGLNDCRRLEIPPGNVFVMGDNRKASMDSRYEIGLVHENDIHYVLPWTGQDEYRSTWRDTSADKSLAHTSTLDPREFVRILNEKRRQKNLKSLTYVDALGQSAGIRGKAMIDADDFSIEATRAGVNLEQAVKRTGYRNIILAEALTKGFYESGELLENLLEFPETVKILFSETYQDIGVAPVVGEIAGCPVQTVVLHLAGYVAPDYRKSDLESWQKLIENLTGVLPSWEAARNIEGTDKDRLERLISILNTRIANARRILSRMQANQWLSEEEERMAQEDESLGSEANRIIGELNK